MHRARDGARVAWAFERVITNDVYVPKGVSINVARELVVPTDSSSSMRGYRSIKAKECKTHNL
jgi:hypothetical protein